MMGSPAQWSTLVERLASESPVRERFQFGTLAYDSLQSIPTSGAELATAIAEARRRLDPEGHDDSFDRVVLVGHSLGGLVAKAAATTRVDGGSKPISPRIERLVFIATPHRGTPMDDGLLRSAGTWLARQSLKGRPLRASAATSLDQLTPGNPLLEDLERRRVATGIPAHTIIASLGGSPEETMTDGVISIASAHLGGVRSELVVTSSHACLGQPEVIGEVRRILASYRDESVPRSLAEVSAANH
jgi:hypothetical protein